MSFGFRGFEQDPFFSGTGFPSMPMHMGFGGDPFVQRRQNALTGPQRAPNQSHGHHPNSQLVLRDPFTSMWPFGGGSPFARMDMMFQNVHQTMREAENNPNVHSYSTSSVMHYSSNGGNGGQPKMYHATTSTRKAPGGIKETRKSVRDSESGVHKMSVGHHIGDRSHTVEKERNVKTKEMKEQQEFINLTEDDAGHFDREWQNKTRPFASRHHHPSAIGPNRRHHHHHGNHERRGLPSPPAAARGVEEPLTHISGRRRNRPASFAEESSVDPVRDKEREKKDHRSKGVRFDSDTCGQSSHAKYRKTAL